MLGSVALVRTEVSEELSASIIRVTRIGGLETTEITTSCEEHDWSDAAKTRLSGVLLYRLGIVPNRKNYMLFSNL
jgi:hypothetical protein